MSKMDMVAVFRKWYNYRIELRKARRLDSWYRKRLKKRNEQEFVARWDTMGHVNLELLKEFADIMELSNHFIFPHDRMFILFCNPYSDMREVEALLLMEEYGISIMDSSLIESEYKYAKDIFRRTR